MAMHGEQRIVENVPRAFADLVVAEAPASIALSGGDTARQAYELLAVADVAWRDVDVWFGDERWVPVHDPASNEGMARFAFLDGVAPRAIHSMYGSGESEDAGAAAYDAALREAPPIDLLHLGVGPDGHTASLFPRSPALDERDRLVVATGDDDHPHRRLTFTLPAIARARLVVVTVAGEEKRDAVARVRASDDPPAGRIDAPRVVWLLDSAAAGAA